MASICSKVATKLSFEHMSTMSKSTSPIDDEVKEIPISFFRNEATNSSQINTQEKSVKNDTSS